MLAGPSEPGELSPVSRALETSEPTAEPTASHGVLPTRSSEPTREPHIAELTDHRPIIQPADQQISREPVLIPAEPNIVKAAETGLETDDRESTEPEPETDETERQITTLAQRLKVGDRLTKTTAAQLLGVSPATAGRRLKEARARINEGTGLYL
jgi:predicted DNA-binding protein (UPF0251 family)